MAKSPTKKKVQPEATITKNHLDGSTTEVKEKVGPEIEYTEPVCNVGISAGFTRNAGNYNSIKMSVSLFMPCYPNEVEEVYGIVKEFTDEKLSGLWEEVNALIAAGGF